MKMNGKSMENRWEINGNQWIINEQSMEINGNQQKSMEINEKQ